MESIEPVEDIDEEGGEVVALMIGEVAETAATLDGREAQLDGKGGGVWHPS